MKLLKIIGLAVIATVVLFYSAYTLSPVARKIFTASEPVITQSPALAAATLIEAIVATPEPEPGVTISFVGDIVPGTNENADTLAHLAPLFAQADVAIGNLEGVLTEAKVAKCDPTAPKCYAFRGDPSQIETFKRAGFDALNLANNHSFDYLGQGLRDTIATLRDAGITPVGRKGNVATIEHNGITIG
ncbi:MAG TPA: CapA family protein, partial [Blastocatellia bacterium]|nr:CapA family protein [Blastocatellia bacterium]